MIELLVPLGLLGLIGIAVLILIYILKPNYQQKIVSSTYVWKLSLRYRGKRIPVSLLRSLLLLLCQILALTACAFILAQPVIPAGAERDENEQILIIDASANMLAADENMTRFERAVDLVIEQAGQVLNESGVVSVILADEEAEVLVNRADESQRLEVVDALDELVAGGALRCSYGAADLEGAMSLATRILDLNPFAEVYYFTATEYVNEGDVTVVDVRGERDWNAAILDAEISLEENFYTFTVDLASYGRASSVDLHCDIYGANNDRVTVSLVYPNIQCAMGETQTVVFRTGVNEAPVSCEIPVSAYDSVLIWIEIPEEDGYSYDDTITLYGGRPEAINILYASSKMNPFVSNALMALRSELALRWDIKIQEERVGGTTYEEVAEGYDFYVFEGVAPEVYPADGVVVLLDPPTVINRTDIIFGNQIQYPNPGIDMTIGEPHPITDGLIQSYLSATRYTQILASNGYEALMFIGEDPVLIYKDQPGSQIVVMPFSVNYTSLPLVNLPTLFYNIFNYYIPSAVTNAEGEAGFMFEIGDTVDLSARGTGLTLTDPSGTETPIDSSFEQIVAEQPGVYRVTQVLSSGMMQTSEFYVKVAAAESDVTRTEDTLFNPAFPELPENEDLDLLFYFAIGLAALLFIEWLLQLKDNF